MSREDAIVVEGTVIEVLPGALFRVELKNGHRFLGHVRAGEKSAARFVDGDRVTVEMTPFDLTKGRIRIERNL